MSTAVSPETVPARRRLKIRLDRDYDDFTRGPRIVAFISDLADALGIPATEIALLSTWSGCVILLVEIPEALAAELLEEATPDNAGTSIDASKLKALRIKYAVDRISDPSFGGQLIPSRMPSIPRGIHAGFGSNADLTWLHLSDLHITEDYDDLLSGTRAELDRFLEDLPGCLAASKIQPDAVFFTGDVAQSGVTAEYRAANAFFTRLRATPPLNSERIPFLIVPGNHDVAWHNIDPDLELGLREQLCDPETDWKTVVAVQDEYIRTRQSAYLEFSQKVNDSTTNSADGYGFSYILELPRHEIAVGVAGLNSAWLSTRQDLFKAKGIPYATPNLDLQTLRLGEMQLRSTRNAIGESAVRIALVHHEPLSQWYCEDDRETQRQELTFFDFILRGHQHEAVTRVSARLAGDDDFLELAPGALRTQPHYYQGFMATQLNLRNGIIKITAWTSTKSGRWVLDPEFGAGGSEIRRVPARLLRRIPAMLDNGDAADQER